jgi:hypothetical protein
MARLVDCASTLNGGSLASRLHSHSRHGDLASSTFVQRIMDSVCSPIFSMLIRWLINGEIHDHCKEFFIGQNPSSMIRNNWKDLFYLRFHQIPIFISSLLVEKIVNIGKSITFIKLCLEKLPKAIYYQSTTSKGNGIRKSYRLINKSKKLGLYGKVMDEDEEIFNEKQQQQQQQQNKENEGEAGVGRENEVEEEKEVQNEVSEDQEEGEGEGDKDKNKLVKYSASASSKTTNQPKSSKRLKKYSSSTDEITTFLSSLHKQYDLHTILSNLRYNGELAFSKMIYHLSNSVDYQLLSLMKEQFHLKSHLLALKKMMLLGQGDFITCLMDNIGPELKKRSSQLFRHNLLSLLETSIRSSNIQYEPPYVVDRITIRLLETTLPTTNAGVARASASNASVTSVSSTVIDSGWDIFSLDYIIDIPLNAIVHIDAMMKYRIAFHMLWRLKRVEWSLTITWKQFLSFSHSYDYLYRLIRSSTDKKEVVSSAATTAPVTEKSTNQQLVNSLTPFLIELKAIFHSCNLTRAHMIHVINNLSAFLMFEVMETSWITLEEKIENSKSLNDVIIAHDNYLTEILERSLLSEQYESLNFQLQELLNLILRFCYFEEQLVSG